MWDDSFCFYKISRKKNKRSIIFQYCLINIFKLTWKIIYLNKFENSEIVHVKVLYRRKNYVLKCKVENGEILDTIPKSLELLKDINTHSKRKASITTKNLINPQEKSRQRTVMTSSDSEEISDKESPNDQIFEPRNETTSKLLSKNLTNALSLKQNEENILEEFNVEKLYDMDTKGEFPKKMFIFGQDKCRYTQRLHFFTSIRTFSERPKNHVSFSCKICSKILRATFP